MSENPTKVEFPSARSMLTTRTFNAPRSLMWKAWSDPEQIAKWWGPHGFSNTFESFEFRKGGQWRFVMRGPNGADYPNQSVFEEVVPEEKIVFKHVGAPRFTMTVLLEDLGAKCRMSWRMDFETEEIMKGLKPVIMPGNIENFERLESHLARDRSLVTTRMVHGPIDLVWKAFTDPKHVDNWWGPNGFKNSDSVMDFRVGGTWRFIMNGPKGMVFPNRIVYTEISAPTFMAFDHGDDESIHFQSTIRLQAQGSKTLVTMIAVFPSKEIRDETVKNVHAVEGAKQTLAKLDAYLATMT